MDTEQQPDNPAPAPRSTPPAAPFFMALAALVLALWVWIDQRQAAHGVEQELGRRIAEMETRNKEAAALAAQTQENTRDALNRLAALESRQAESQSQQLALEALYQEMSRSRDEWALADVERLLLTAGEQLQLTGNVRAALIALQTADGRLQRHDRPQWLPLRKAIAQDIHRLQTLPAADTAGLALRLDALATSLGDLPLALEPHPRQAVKEEGRAQPEGFWQKLGREAWDDFRQLVRIQRLANPDAPLLSPAQGTQVRENVRLRLLSARLAVLQRDPRNYRADLKAVEDALNRYFDTGEAAVRATQAEVKKLADEPIAPEGLEITASLTALAHVKGGRERGAR